MPPTRRRFDAGITQRLLDEPQRFGYFQAVRLLELYFARRGVRTQDIVAERLRFKNTLSLAFPASEIEQAEAMAADGTAIIDAIQLAHAVEEGDFQSVDITPAFFGLLGTSGALPLQYTERLMRREIYQRDHAARAFLDIFSNRSAALFYTAWKKYRLPLQYELDRNDRALPLMLSLTGLNYKPLRDKLQSRPGRIFDESLAYYTGALWRRPTSAAMLQRVLSDYFQVAVNVEQFVAQWYPVPSEQRSYLGQSNASLGRGALAGERVLQCDLRVRLWIGPLDRAQFTDFLPGGESAGALAKMVQILTGNRLEYEVKLILQPSEVRGAALFDQRDDGRLGWDAFLCTRLPMEPRSDASYQL